MKTSLFVPLTALAVSCQVAETDTVWVEETAEVGASSRHSVVLPEGHPAVHSADAITVDALPPGHPPTEHVGLKVFVPLPGKLRVDSATPSIADVFTQRADLSGTRVQVTARVVAVHANILGKTWVRLRDSHSGPELVASTQDAPSVGDLVLVEGVLAVDRDIGGGYVFEALLEGAEFDTPVLPTGI